MEKGEEQGKLKGNRRKNTGKPEEAKGEHEEKP